MIETDKKRFYAAMVALFKVFRVPEDKDVVKIFFKGLDYLTIEDAEKCLDIVITTGDRFPTVHDLRRAVAQIPAKNVPQIPYNPKYGECLASDATKLITAVMDGKLGREQLIEGMEVMHKKYPHIGWNEQAAALAAYYSRDERERDNPAHFQDDNYDEPLPV